MSVEWRPVDGLVACAAGAGGVSAAVTEASLMTHQYRAGAELVPVGQRVGGWVIHLPSVVCTSSPSTIAGLFRPNRAKLGPATCRILGSALAERISRGDGPPFYLVCRVFTGLWRAGVE